MTLYSRAWTVLAVLLGALGVVEAVLAVPPLTTWTAATAVAALACLAQLSQVSRRNPPQGPGWRTVHVAVVAGTVGAATTGLAALLGGAAAVLVVLTVSGHPSVLLGVHRRVRHVLLRLGVPAWPSSAPPVRPARPVRPDLPVRSASPAGAGDPATGSTRPRDWASKVIPSAPTDETRPRAAGVRSLTTADLCLRWRASFIALEQADPSTGYRHWAALIAVRRCYLDEIARRDPAGFARWLHAGARPASDPSRYLVGPLTPSGDGAPRGGTGVGPPEPGERPA